MQIILLEKVVNLGQLGDVVRVRDGYARNFLIPQGKAKRATDTAIKEFETRRAELEKVQADKLAAAQALAEKLNDMTIQVTEKAGVDGRLFGSVTNFDIAEGLKKQGFEVEKGMVRLPNGPLKTIGDAKVEVALHSDVVVEITVSVLGASTFSIQSTSSRVTTPLSDAVRIELEIDAIAPIVRDRFYRDTTAIHHTPRTLVSGAIGIAVRWP